MFITYIFEHSHSDFYFIFVAFKVVLTSLASPDCLWRGHAAARTIMLRMDVRKLLRSKSHSHKHTATDQCVYSLLMRAGDRLLCCTTWLNVCGIVPVWVSQKCTGTLMLHCHFKRKTWRVRSCEVFSNTYLSRSSEVDGQQSIILYMFAKIRCM